MYRILLVAPFLICACTGNGVTFTNDDIFVKLRNGGHVMSGYVEQPYEMHEHEKFHNKLSLIFKQLRFSTPTNYDIFKTEGHERFHVHNNGFWHIRGLQVEGMSMTMNLPAPGIVFKIKGAILTEDGQFLSGDNSVTELKQGDVIVSLQLTPSDDDETDCIPCQLDEGHVIRIDLDVRHFGSPEISDVFSRELAGFQSVEYSDGSAAYIPEQVMIDGDIERVNLNISHETDNRHNVVVRLPAPLGDSMEVDFVFKVKERNTQSPTTSAPKPEILTDKIKRKDAVTTAAIPRDMEERSRDHANTGAAINPEPKVIQVKHTTTTKTTTMKSTTFKDQEYKAISSIKDTEPHNGCPTRTVIARSTLTLLLSTVIFLVR